MPESIEQTEIDDQSSTDNDGDSDESSNVDVVDNNSSQPTAEVEALSTFSEQEGPFSYKILPVVDRTGADWRIVAYMDGVQGPVYQSTSKISDEAADELGMSRRLQDRINEALDYADQNLEIPTTLGNQERQKQSLADLEAHMDENQ